VTPSLTLNPVSENDSLGGFKVMAPVLGGLDVPGGFDELIASPAPPDPPQATMNERKPRLPKRNNRLTRTPIEFIPSLFNKKLI
jgi:hypothetical protein